MRDFNLTSIRKICNSAVNDDRSYRKQKKTRVDAHTSRYDIIHNQPYITAQEGLLL